MESPCELREWRISGHFLASQDSRPSLIAQYLNQEAKISQLAKFRDLRLVIMKEISRKQLVFLPWPTD